MKDVPKFVRQRMVEPVGGDHPEANLLAAFAEGGLTGREREQVLSHLGKCAACRETLAVAMPQVAAEHSHAAAAPSGTRWLRWPMLRWAGVGAAVVVVAAAVVIQSSRRSVEVPKISVAAPAVQSEQARASAKPAVADEVAPVLAGRVPSQTERAPRKEAAIGRDVRAKAENRTDKKKDASAGQFVNAAPTLAANKVAESNAPLQPQAVTESYAAAQSAKVQQPTSRVAAGVAGAAAMEQKQQQATPAVPPVPTADESFEVAAQSGAVQMQKAKPQEMDEMKAARARTAANARATTGGVAASVTGSAGPMSSDSAAVSVAPAMKAALAVAPHWRLSTEGALERSTDAGRTWQLVRVAAPPPTLRSFSALDRDLWAGGAGGALYHSADNGRTWARVTVKSGDSVLGSDIVRVEFTDAQHGALTTASGEKWTTGDGGLSWSVRR